ncbi:hypothetical protein J6590_065505 [Homalodisca vitripennis]|nr:hypothetical protein J6590_065505 [Homalodisca vitripennis]
MDVGHKDTFSTDARVYTNRALTATTWLLLGWVTAERSCPYKQLACPAVGGGSEVTFKPLFPSANFPQRFILHNDYSALRAAKRVAGRYRKALTHLSLYSDHSTVTRTRGLANLRSVEYWRYCCLITSEASQPVIHLAVYRNLHKVQEFSKPEVAVAEASVAGYCCLITSAVTQPVYIWLFTATFTKYQSLASPNYPTCIHLAVYRNLHKVPEFSKPEVAVVGASVTGYGCLITSAVTQPVYIWLFTATFTKYQSLASPKILLFNYFRSYPTCIHLAVYRNLHKVPEFSKPEVAVVGASVTGYGCLITSAAVYRNLHKVPEFSKPEVAVVGASVTGYGCLITSAVTQPFSKPEVAVVGASVAGYCCLITSEASQPVIHLAVYRNLQKVPEFSKPECDRIWLFNYFRSYPTCIRLAVYRNLQKVPEFSKPEVAVVRASVAGYCCLITSEASQPVIHLAVYRNLHKVPEFSKPEVAVVGASVAGYCCLITSEASQPVIHLAVYRNLHKVAEFSKPEVAVVGASVAGYCCLITSEASQPVIHLAVYRNLHKVPEFSKPEVAVVGASVAGYYCLITSAVT